MEKLLYVLGLKTIDIGKFRLSVKLMMKTTHLYQL